MKKGTTNLKGGRAGVWEDLEGGKGRGRWCNYDLESNRKKVKTPQKAVVELMGESMAELMRVSFYSVTERNNKTLRIH